MRKTVVRRALALLALLGSLAVATEAAVPAPRARVVLTYLLPAPREAIVFAPYALAEHDGLYAKAGLDVRFKTVSGGANVGAALARGEGDLGGAVGDTPMLLRGKGIGVQGVALLGEHAFLTLMMRKGTTLDAAGLRSKRFGVPSLQDTSYYALSALIRGTGLSLADVTIRAAPPADLIAALGAGDLAGIVGTVDWGVKAERAGVALDYHPADTVFPALAQVVMASDSAIAERPDAIRGFVSATLSAIASIQRNPGAAATRYAAAVPQSGYSHAEIVRIFRLLSLQIYGRTRGGFDATRMDAAARAASDLKLLPAGSSARGSYTNALTGRR